MKRKFLLRAIFVAAIKAENMKGIARSNRRRMFYLWVWFNLEINFALTTFGAELGRRKQTQTAALGMLTG